MTEWLLILSFVVLVVVTARVMVWRRRPTAVAAARVRAQLADVRQGLERRDHDGDSVAAEEQRLRSKWLDERLQSTPIEALKPAGIGAAAHETLRHHGINTLADAPRIGGMQIRGFGDRKRGSLLQEAAQMRERLHVESRRLSWDEVDRMGDGVLSRMRDAAAARARERARDVEGLEIRRRELERRLAQLKVRRSVWAWVRMVFASRAG
jgi:DNA-binding helix-hairpin-helix protein with protein kinase domain